MDCSICTTMPLILRPPRNTICAGCYEAARTTISLVNNFESGEKGPSSTIDHHPAQSHKPNSNTATCKPQPLANLPRWIKSMKDKEDELTDKIDFLSNFVDMFRSQLLTDIYLRPGTDAAPSIPAHRALLAARSEIFKTMLDTEAWKAPANDTITLPELNYDELESLLEFLYSGSLPREKLERNVYSLTLAADKYEIPYLLNFCRRHMLKTLDSSTALEVLEISEAVCSSNELKEAALRYVVKNMDELAFSGKYDVFVARNPHLAVQVTRAFLVDTKQLLLLHNKQ
ncbi:BTB/POZ domain-containing protein At3g56230 [Linum perenne]